MLKGRKGIELSVNFIVMLVLAIAVFGGSLAFATKFFTKAESMRANLDAETERQIEKLLDSGSPVVLPISTKEIFRKKYDTFGLGILAKYPTDGTVGKYIVEYSSNGRINKDKTKDTGDYSDWLQVSPASLDLKKNEKGRVLILVTVPADAVGGTYIFQFTVKYMGNNYDNPVQLMIKVP